MNLLSLNNIVPQMQNAPHQIYMMEFDHSQGELFVFNQNPVGFMQQFPEFSGVNEKTTLNIIGVEGDKQGRNHDLITKTHALVADLRPLGIYCIYWAKGETADGLKKALSHPLLTKFSNLLPPTP